MERYTIYEVTLLPKDAMDYPVILGQDYIKAKFELKRKVNNLDSKADTIYRSK